MENPLILRNRSVLVLGFGVSGKAAVHYFVNRGARVYVSDLRSEQDLSPEEKEQLSTWCEAYEVGGHTSFFLEKVDLVFISPGIPDDLPLLQEAKAKKIAVLGELACVAHSLRPHTIAITGTNGKTTVTTLIGHLLSTAGQEVFIGGNIGRPLFECILSDKHVDAAVVEVSSFQLERAGEFRPDVGVLLNITPDHLDRHNGMSAYIQAKSNIFARQKDEDIAIVCTDNVLCKELADHMEGGVLCFGHSRECDGYICESEVYLRYRGEVEVYSLGETVFDNPMGRLNCAAAILAARHSGCSREDVLRGLLSFAPLPHRMEEVATINGVSYINDSKATNTGAVISALQQAKGKVVLIAGGKEKGEDYSPLCQSVSEKVRMLILLGQAARPLFDSLGDLTKTVFAETLEEAVVLASKSAKEGDIVLLSPACASFDMFDSYTHRGQVFRDGVRELEENSRNVKAKV